MAMTPLEASTLVLLHCEDFKDSSSRRGRGVQAMTSQPVSVTTARSKFGSACIDLQASTYGGLALPNAFTLADLMAATLECWVWIRAFGRIGVFASGYSTSLSLPMFSIAHSAAGLPQGVFRDTGLNGNVMSGPAPLPTEAWTHLEFSVDESRVRRLFVGGTLVASASTTANGGMPTTLSDTFCIGGNGVDNFAPNALIDEVRYVAGHCLHTSDFTPPAAPFADPPSIAGAAIWGLPGVRRSQSFDRVTPIKLAGTTKLKDVNYGGRGLISGTVKLKASPANVPLHCRVWLVRERDAMVIRETWSDATTGAYAFPYIDETQRYSVLSYDHTGDKRAVIANNLTAEVI